MKIEQNSAKSMAMAATIAVLLMGSGVASATDLTISDYGSNNQGMTLNFPSVTGGNGGPNFGTSAGTMNINDGTNNYVAYCIDPLTSLTNPNKPYVLQTLGTYLTQGGAYDTQFLQTRYVDAGTGSAGELFTNQRTVLQSRLEELYKYAYKDSLNDATNGAAFQYAIWELVGESDAQLGAGVGGLKMTGNANAAARANQYLSALTAASEATAWSNLGLSANANTYIFNVWVPNPQLGSQAHVFVTEGGPTGGSNVPEPSTAALGLLGVLAAMRSLKARRKTALHH